MNKFLSLGLLLASCFVAEAQPFFPPATQAETDAGVVPSKFVSPFTLRHTTGLPVSATNAIAQVNGSTSNKQWIVVWTAAETSNTFGVQQADGAQGGTNFFHLPFTDATHSGQLSSNDWTTFKGSQVGSFVLSNLVTLGATNYDPSQFVVAGGKVYFAVGAKATNLSVLAFTNRGDTLLQGNFIQTNGWAMFGDPVTPGPLTNNGLTYLNNDFVQAPSHLAYFNSDIWQYSNGCVVIFGVNASDHNIIKFDSYSYIVDSLISDAVPSSVETNRYRFFNSGLTTGLMSNVIARYFEVTNIANAFALTRQQGSAILTNLVNTGVITNVVNNATNLVATEVGLVGPTNNGDVRIKGLIQGANITLVNNGTNISIASAAAAAAGGAGSVQFIEGGGLAGTNDFLFDRTNAVLTLGKLGDPNPRFSIVETSHELDLFPTKIVEAANTPLYIGINGITNWFWSGGNSAITGGFFPTADNLYDIGLQGNRVRSNSVNNIDTTNILTRGAGYLFTGHPLQSGGSVGTNLVADGTIGDYFTNVITALVATTNLVITNVLDGQPIVIDLFPTNGVVVAISVGSQIAPTSWFLDGNSTLATNGWNRLHVTRFGNITNLFIEGPSAVLAAGANITFTTNFTVSPQTVTIASSGGGGAGVVQWQTNNTIVNVGQTNFDLFVYDMGMFATNNTQSNKVDYALYGKTNFNLATLGTAWLTNQLIMVPLNLNGSNGVSAVAVTNMLDFTVNSYRPFTNVIGTNQTCIFTNVGDGKTIFATFIGINGYTNNMFIQSQPGTTIRWMNWNTNPQPDIVVRPNQAYWLQAFGSTNSSATNIFVTVGTDDSYASGNFWQLGVSNLVATNISVTAGQSTSNAYVGGKVFFYTAEPGFTNLNATITTFSNAASWTIPAGMLTNSGDSCLSLWRGNAIAGTNELKVVYGLNTVIDFQFTNAFTVWELGVEVTRSTAVANHVDAWLTFQQVGPTTTIAAMYGFRTNMFLTAITNGVANSNMLQMASRALGGITNNWATMTYSPYGAH